MEYFDTEGKNYFDIFESIIDVEHNELGVGDCTMICIRELHWDEDQETHIEEDVYTLGINIETYDDDFENEKEFIFSSEDEANKAGFEVTVQEDDHYFGESPTKEKTLNYAKDRYSWLPNIKS
tara:strand:- start:180 stop:548 length:369 start_codon:yes stop_codon:yes gene_type:complete